MANSIIDNTPWECYDVDGIYVHVKREDLCAPHPGPSFSKIRGLVRHLEKQTGRVIGVMDTRHSKAGWGVAWLCQQMGLQCIDFYPELKGDNGNLRENQVMAQSFGAELHPFPGGMSAVLYNRARKYMRETYDNYTMLPNGLKLAESVDATAKELEQSTPKELCRGTWVVSISSGTIAAGVARGLATPWYHKLSLVCHMGYSRSESQVLRYVQNMAIVSPEIQMVDEGYEYKDKVDNEWVPFPCNEYYDAKAFWWLARHVHELKQPIIFWNIGD